MLKTVNTYKLIFIGGMSAFAVSACAPSHHGAADGQFGYGYDNAAYGYDYVADQPSYGYADYGYGAQQDSTVVHKSRYGDQLRGPCEITIQDCGLMAVVPVYPVYQIITPAPTYEPPVVEAPVITLPEPEPEPIVIHEPEPVYEPPVYEPVTNYWPEPETPVTTWKPLRK